MDGGKTSANWITINNGQFSSGTYIKGTFKTDTANITNLTATSASFSGDVTVNGVLNSTEMQTNIVKAVGGQLYVCPTYIPSVNGTMLCTGADTGYVTFTITDSTSITAITYGGANWNQGSKIMFTGVITGNKGGNPEVVFASAQGELTAAMNSTANKLQIKVYYDGANKYFQNSNTNITYSDMSVMMYQIKSGDNFYPVGVYIKAYGNDNKNSYIDIYGGTSTTPNSRLGLVTGVPNMSNGTTPTGWGIYTTNGFFDGTIVSSSGTIGGWGIGQSVLSNGTLGATNSVWLMTADRENADAVAIGGSSTALTTWRVAVGNNFGVTKDGTLYASSANISGQVTATTGYIGGTSGFTITSGKMYSNNHSAYNTAVSGVYIGTDYISLGSGGATYFKNDGTGKIGPWNITSTSIYKTNSTMGSSATGAAYFGDNGLSITDKFQVTSAGVLSATSAEITGEIHASSGSTFGDLNYAHIEISQGGMDILYGNRNITHIGYDPSMAQAGFGSYYTFGTRLTNSLIGDQSFGAGRDVVASGAYSFAEGYQTKAVGTYSHAEGMLCEASTNGSYIEYTTLAGGGVTGMYTDLATVPSAATHAEGAATHAIGNESHSEGHSTYAYGDASHAENYNNVTYGFGSHSGGFQSFVYADYGFAHGIGCRVATEAQFVIGKYNNLIVNDYEESPDTGVLVPIDPPGYETGNYSFIIGNGTADDARSNALTVDWSGNLVTAGSITSNGYSVLTTNSVVNNLTSTSTTAPLSAAQGKALNDKITTIGTLSATNGSDKNLTANTEVTICTLSLSAGTYICTGDVHWPSSSTDAVKKLRVKASNGAYATQQVRTQWYTETNATLIFTSNSACTLSLTAESAIALTGSSGILRAIRVK